MGRFRFRAGAGAKNSTACECGRRQRFLTNVISLHHCSEAKSNNVSIRQLKPREKKKCPQGPSREGICTSLVSTAAGSSLHKAEVGTEQKDLTGQRE